MAKLNVDVTLTTIVTPDQLLQAIPRTLEQVPVADRLTWLVDLFSALEDAGVELECLEEAFALRAQAGEW